MAVVSQNGIAYIVIVRCLYVVKQNNVLQLYGVPYYAVCANQSGASDEGAVAYLGVGSDDTGCAQIF